MSVSLQNSLAMTNKLAGYTFFGTYGEVLAYSQVMVAISTTSAVNNYKLRIYYSPDKVNATLVEQYEFTNQLAKITYSVPVSKYVKVEVEMLTNMNNIIIETIFKSEVVYVPSPDVPSSAVTVTSGNIIVDSVTASVVVTGPLTNDQLRDTAVPISGTVSTGCLTDTELRASAVPISGTVSTGGLTDTELRATAVPVSIADDVIVQNGVIDLGNSTVVPLSIGQYFAGSWTSTLNVAQINVSVETDWESTLVIYYSSDGVNVGTSISAACNANVPNTFTFEPLMNFFFVYLTPNIENQSYLRLSTTLKSVVPYKALQKVSITGMVSTGGLTDTELRASAVPISGTVSTGGLTDTELRASAVPISGTVSTGGLTDTELRASAVPISGTVSTGGLTDTELRASAVPVSGTVSTGGLTDTELRASAVPVSGTVSTGCLTDTELRASAVPISLPEGAVVLTQESPTITSYYGYNFGNTGTVVSAIPTVIRNFSLNTTAAIITYVYIYDLSTAPTSANTPSFMHVIQNSNNVVFNSFDHQFVNGIGIRASTTLNGTISPAANSVIINMTLSD